MGGLTGDALLAPLLTYRRCCAQVEGDAQYDEQMDVEIMRVLITSYYNIVRKHFQDAVPKVHSV